MKIAYISYEYPPDTAVGGIATYVHQVSRMMLARGHTVEVFCASTHRTISEVVDGIKVNRVLCTDREIFHTIILPFFETANEAGKFDLMESPEFSGDGLSIKRNFMHIPLVVRLHIPWFLVDIINNHYLTYLQKCRFMLSGIIRGKLYRRFWKPRNTKTDPDYLTTMLADQIHTPSISLGDIVARKWRIDRNRILNIPNLFAPGKELLSIPSSTNTNTITYIGRLEVRKGLVKLAAALSIVLKAKPFIKVKFVGGIQKSPVKGLDMKEYLLEKLKDYRDNLEFTLVPAHQIAEVYANTDICVFPSIWENFPYSCLEAMSAARGIVASREGGMKDMLEDCDGGLLIDPSNHTEIAKELIRLIDNPDLRVKLGENARKKVATAYSNEKIGALLEENYSKLI
ncbi:glycosyltransferase family 4 protein [Mucilaginibacter rubeus]|uniref:Glycosyltransferase family 4 protein n=1 Tax=Mucilaginibacter rubeus TaxID=2027860 RepID=A0A5C1I289_9SPHI|nr:glycosyltransferase family 4 protein [Mucilaginibacter rubeus]QEM11420.1 glycosyltransferase family 4 protein [Mucilaginibacter rubeus]